MPAMTTVGVAGGRWRADVTLWGSIRPWDGSPPLDWHVAADDRWHVPEHEPAVRQVAVGGTPVLETRLRIPSGDALHRTWTVADGGGQTLVEVANESPLPLAVAFSRPDLRTARPPAPMPIRGIDLPASTIVLPVGHHASVTVSLAHRHPAAGPLPSGWPAPDAVVRGWQAAAARASRLELPDLSIGERVIAARSAVTLEGPLDPDADPAGFLLGVAELVRMGDDAAGWVADIAAVIERIARRPGWDVDAALDAAAIVVARGGEQRGGRDLAALVARRSRSPWPTEVAAGIRGVPAIEGRLARGGTLLPEGIPPGWRGSGFEAHGVPVGPAATISFAVRWHGARPAVLWEVVGEPVELTAPAVDPDWRSNAPSGEALWRGA